jgi:hypothetical protein
MKAALAEAADAEDAATAALMLARKAADHAVALRAAVALDALAARMLLRGYVKTAQGEAFAADSDGLRALARQEAAARKARRTRARNKR